MLSILCVILTIKVMVAMPESFKEGWYPPKKTGSSHLKGRGNSLSSNTHCGNIKSSGLNVMDLSEWNPDRVSHPFSSTKIIYKYGS